MLYIRLLFSIIVKGLKCYCVYFFLYILISVILYFDFLLLYIEMYILVWFLIIIVFMLNSDNIYCCLSCLLLNC